MKQVYPSQLTFHLPISYIQRTQTTSLLMADILVLNGAGPSVGTMMTIYEISLMLLALSQWWEIIWNVKTFFISWNKFDTKGLRNGFLTATHFPGQYSSHSPNWTLLGKVMITCMSELGHHCLNDLSTAWPCSSTYSSVMINRNP